MYLVKMDSNATLPILVEVYMRGQKTNAFQFPSDIIVCVLTIVWDLLIVLDGLQVKSESAYTATGS